MKHDSKTDDDIKGHKVTTITVSQELRDAVKKQFTGISGRLELILHEGGIRDGRLEFRLK